MKECLLPALFLGSKIAFAILAYFAVANNIRYQGWFVFLAVFYALFATLNIQG